MMKYKTILFDMDGTIADSSRGIYNSVEYALDKFGITADRDTMRRFIGPPLKTSFVQFYQFSELQAYTAIDYYRVKYEESGVYETELYDGIIDLLKTLKAQGSRLAIASSKPTYFINKILDSFQIGDLFDCVSGSELDGSRSEKTEVIKYALDALGINHGDKTTLMIGDRYFDIDGANQFGLDSAAVLYGFGTREELVQHNPTHIIETVADLAKILTKN